MPFRKTGLPFTTIRFDGEVGLLEVLGVGVALALVVGEALALGVAELGAGLAGTEDPPLADGLGFGVPAPG